MESRTPSAEALTELILEIFRVNGDLLAHGDRITRDFGQTSARWQVLGAIRHTPQPVAGIARVMGLARQSVQRTADLLEAEGLVEYAPNPAHRRAKLVRLSARGQETLIQISRRQIAWTNALTAAMRAGEGEIRVAVEVLRQLRAELESQDGSLTQEGLPSERDMPERRSQLSDDGKGSSTDGQSGSDQSIRGSRRAGRR